MVGNFKNFNIDTFNEEIPKPYMSRAEDHRIKQNLIKKNLHANEQDFENLRQVVKFFDDEGNYIKVHLESDPFKRVAFVKILGRTEEEVKQHYQLLVFCALAYPRHECRPYFTEIDYYKKITNFMENNTFFYFNQDWHNWIDRDKVLYKAYQKYEDKMQEYVNSLQIYQNIFTKQKRYMQLLKATNSKVDLILKAEQRAFWEKCFVHED